MDLLNLVAKNSNADLDKKAFKTIHDELKKQDKSKIVTFKNQNNEKVTMILVKDDSVGGEVAYLKVGGGKATLVQEWSYDRGEMKIVTLNSGKTFLTVDEKNTSAVEKALSDKVLRNTKDFIDNLNELNQQKEYEKKKKKEDEKKSKLIATQPTPAQQTTSTEPAKAVNNNGGKNMDKATKKNMKNAAKNEEKYGTYLADFIARMQAKVNTVSDYRADKSEQYPDEKLDLLSKRVLQDCKKNCDYYDKLTKNDAEIEKILVSTAGTMLKEHFAIETTEALIRQELFTYLATNERINFTIGPVRTSEGKIKSVTNKFTSVEDIKGVNNIDDKIFTSRLFAEKLVDLVIKRNKKEFSNEVVENLVEDTYKQVLKTALTDKDVFEIIDSHKYWLVDPEGVVRDVVKERVKEIESSAVNGAKWFRSYESIKKAENNDMTDEQKAKWKKATDAIIGKGGNKVKPVETPIVEAKDNKPKILRIVATVKGEKHKVYQYLIVAPHVNRPSDQSVYMVPGENLSKCFDRDGNLVSSKELLGLTGTQGQLGNVVDKVKGRNSKKVEYNVFRNKNNVTRDYAQSENKGTVLEIKNGAIVETDQKPSVTEFLQENLEDKKYKEVVRKGSMKARTKAIVAVATVAAAVALFVGHGVTPPNVENMVKKDLEDHFSAKNAQQKNETTLFFNYIKDKDGNITGVRGINSTFKEYLENELKTGIIGPIGNNWMNSKDKKLMVRKMATNGKLLGNSAAAALINSGVSPDQFIEYDKSGNATIKIFPVDTVDGSSISVELDAREYLMKKCGLKESQAVEFLKNWKAGIEEFTSNYDAGLGDITNNSVPQDPEKDPTKPDDPQKDPTDDPSKDPITPPEDKTDYTVNGDQFASNIAKLLGFGEGSDPQIVLADEENGKAFVNIDGDRMAVIDFSANLGANSAEKVQNADLDDVKFISRISDNAIEKLPDAKQNAYAKKFNKFIDKCKEEHDGANVNLYWSDFKAKSENGKSYLKPTIYCVVSDDKGTITEVDELTGRTVIYEGDSKSEYKFVSFIDGIIPSGCDLEGDVEVKSVSVNSRENTAKLFDGDGKVNVETELVK